MAFSYVFLPPQLVLACSELRALCGACAVLCFKCNQPGHVARECPIAYPAALDSYVPPMCLRCGREDCPAAGAGDYVRWGYS